MREGQRQETRTRRSAEDSRRDTCLQEQHKLRKSHSQRRTWGTHLERDFTKAELTHTAWWLVKFRERKVRQESKTTLWCSLGHHAGKSMLVITVSVTRKSVLFTPALSPQAAQGWGFTSLFSHWRLLGSLREPPCGTGEGGSCPVSFLETTCPCSFLSHKHSTHYGDWIIHHICILPGRGIEIKQKRTGLRGQSLKAVLVTSNSHHFQPSLWFLCTQLSHLIPLSTPWGKQGQSHFTESVNWDSEKVSNLPVMELQLELVSVKLKSLRVISLLKSEKRVTFISL